MSHVYSYLESQGMIVIVARKLLHSDNVDSTGRSNPLSCRTTDKRSEVTTRLSPRMKLWWFILENLDGLILFCCGTEIYRVSALTIIRPPTEHKHTRIHTQIRFKPPWWEMSVKPETSCVNRSLRETACPQRLCHHSEYDARQWSETERHSGTTQLTDEELNPSGSDVVANNWKTKCVRVLQAASYIQAPLLNSNVELWTRPRGVWRLKSNLKSAWFSCSVQ